MSEAVARAARRDLRRAIGADGLKLLEAHEAGLAHHAQVLNGHLSSLREHERRLDALTASVAVDEGQLEAQRQSLETMAAALFQVRCGLTWRQRLRWLVRGYV